MFNSRGSLALNFDGTHSFEINFIKLFSQGFITAVANPKGWAFFIAMTPAFINYEIALLPQMSALVIIIFVNRICIVDAICGRRTSSWSYIKKTG